MRIHSESVIRHPRQDAFVAYRDHLSEIAPYIDDIREIRVESREELGDDASGLVVRLHNVWVASREVPAYARSVLKPEMLAWDDFAEWREDEHVCHWRIEPRAFTEAVRCSGTNTFVAIDEHSTRVVLEGEFRLDLRKVRGIPRMLAGPLAPRLERFIVGLITPNLERTNRSLQTYLDDLSR